MTSLEKGSRNVRADEARASGYERSHRLLPSTSGLLSPRTAYWLLVHRSGEIAVNAVVAWHADRVQEEVFVVVSGSMTMLLGDPPERVDVGPQSVVAVEPRTPLQVRNEADEELVVFIYGAPPEQGGADFFDDVELPG